MIFSAPDTKVTRAAQLDGRAQRAQDAPPRVRRLCAITQAWLHRGDASEVFLLEDSRKPHHRPFIAALSHSCGGVDRFTRMRHERPEGLLVICFQNGCHRRAAKREVDSYDRRGGSLLHRKLLAIIAALGGFGGWRFSVCSRSPNERL